MAKKKVEKIETKTVMVKKVDVELQVVKLHALVLGLNDCVVELNQRLDRIVTAIDKSKSVRGL